MRYYSLTSLQKLFEKNNLYIFHAKEIPTHGGSIRVKNKDEEEKQETLLKEIIKKEKKLFHNSNLEKFKKMRK